jgi:predicted Fe-S protein YdhL (DUF1289 family)
MTHVDSPCVDVCRMDARSRLCEGCGRTLNEIAAWSRLDAARRREILTVLPARIRAAAEAGGCGVEAGPGQSTN